MWTSRFETRSEGDLEDAGEEFGTVWFYMTPWQKLKIGMDEVIKDADDPVELEWISQVYESKDDGGCYVVWDIMVPTFVAESIILDIMLEDTEVRKADVQEVTNKNVRVCLLSSQFDKGAVDKLDEVKKMFGALLLIVTGKHYI